MFGAAAGANFKTHTPQVLTSPRRANAIGSEMEEPQQPAQTPAETQADLFSTPAVELGVTLNLAAGAFLFEWARPGETIVVKRGNLAPRRNPAMLFRFHAFAFQFEPEGIESSDRCGVEPSSVHAMMRRIRSRAPGVSAVRGNSFGCRSGSGESGEVSRGRGAAG